MRTKKFLWYLCFVRCKLMRVYIVCPETCTNIHQQIWEADSDDSVQPEEFNKWRLPNLNANKSRFNCWLNRFFLSKMSPLSGWFLTRLLSCAESVNITVLPNGTCELNGKQQGAWKKHPRSNVLSHGYQMGVWFVYNSMFKDPLARGQMQQVNVNRS